MIKRVDESQTLIEELLRLRILCGNRMMKITQARHESDRVGLSVRAMILGSSAQA
jgi:hypothetical protein